MLGSEYRVLRLPPSTSPDMIDDSAKSRAVEIRNLPPLMLDAGILAEYVKTGEAYDLSELCKKSGISLKQVTQIIVACGLDEVDKLPGYTMTREIFELAENLYSNGTSRQQWQQTRTHHKPEYLEGKLPREALKLIESDTASRNRHYADIFFRAWAVFWDDAFLIRIIDKFDSRIIASVPETLLTEKVCFAAVSKSGLALRYVPESLRSLPVCTSAVANNAAAIAFTPSRLRDKIRQLQTAEFD